MNRQIFLYQSTINPVILTAKICNEQNYVAIEYLHSVFERNKQQFSHIETYVHL